MNLEEFQESDFDLLIKWIDSDELNYLWGGPAYVFPLTYEQIHSHCSKAEVFPYLLKVKGRHAGFVELYKVTDEQYRICRVFISNAYRGQGLSKSMLMLLIDKARLNFSATKLSLGVFEQNTVARKCYESLGFEVVSTEIGTRAFNGKLWDLVRMEKRL
ncbi:GNAT family N-acetyltransferase [Vibrio cholerae]|uniref:GNAT family N-acetyltransferase n=1 Tax=Vibrio cholerae TaxID=666 RepID=A0A543XRT7_VIBCL|nr:GNAT family N-acetyltransferase [Vibrio cholerae]MCD6671099.1 GNAT family N-acetyltransferase [Vibrio cholerae]TQO60063.1 GNAT family N-acetyltransferase [Vibrio cholerae]TQP09401.1 GNAT family N-acetyltransferase [Vibrio cholerae]TQP68401.1 GNAT family N-acetyltransferase [Vibrio cholerae]TQQ46912.1 GNAT family N-acetyltransferase [Vibrio cholerae]